MQQLIKENSLHQEKHPDRIINETKALQGEGGQDGDPSQENESSLNSARRVLKLGERI
jgi:hypothetical protein